MQNKGEDKMSYTKSYLEWFKENYPEETPKFDAARIHEWQRRNNRSDNDDDSNIASTLYILLLMILMIGFFIIII